MNNDICYPKGIIVGDPIVYGGPNTLCNTNSLNISANKDHITCASCRMTLGLPILPLNPSTTPLKTFTTEITHTGETNKVEQKITEFKQDLTPHYVEMWTGPKGRTCFKIKVCSSEPALATELAVEQFNRLTKAVDSKFNPILLDQIIPIQEIKVPVKENKYEEETVAEKYAGLKPKTNSFGFFFHKYRMEKNITIRTVSENMNLDLEDVYLFQCNKAWPTTEQLLSISEILNLTDKQYTKLKAKVLEETK